MRARVRGALSVAVPLLACAALASSVPVHPPAPDRPAREEALELLASLPWPVALPFELPAGYEASTIHVSWSPKDGRGHRVRYSAPGGTCFTIEAARGGFGGPVPERSRPIDPVAFRNGSGDELGDRRPRLYWTEGGVGSASGEGPFPEPVVFSDWLRGGDLAHRLFSPREPGMGCRRIDPELAARIVESLRFLGDGGDGEDDPGRWDLGAYLPVSTRRPGIDRRGGEAPEEMAIRVLERMGFPAQSEPSGELGVEQVVETTLGEDGRVRVLVARTGGGDDSVAARRYLVVLIPEADGRWRFLMGRQFSCHEGRGRTGWSKELCL